MIIRALDANGDITFGQGKQNYLTGQVAVGQNIKTRLLCFLNNCYWAMSFGIDWFTFLGGGNTKVQIQLSVTAMIAQSYGVVNINNVSVDVVGRSYQSSYNINTIFTQNFEAQLANIENILVNV